MGHNMIVRLRDSLCMLAFGVFVGCNDPAVGAAINRLAPAIARCAQAFISVGVKTSDPPSSGSPSDKGAE